jgi:hypothetical protein
MKNPNTLIIGDTHLPFTHRHYLAFCHQTRVHYGCKRVVHIGDLVDNHAISFHDHDPDGLSAGAELELVRKELKGWFKAFPKVDVCIGNHDELHRRKAFADGVPAGFLKSFAQAFETPPGWRFDFEYDYGNWRAIHGTGTSGHDAAFKSAMSGRISTASGHVHTAAGIKHHASSRDIIWGMQVGNGIDRKAYAYSYGRDFKDKPIISCGVVLENGTLPLVIPMPM